MDIFNREKSTSIMPVLAEVAGEARQSWFGEDDDHGGQQICELNRATRWLLALSLARALSQPAFTLVASSVPSGCVC